MSACHAGYFSAVAKDHSNLIAVCRYDTWATGSDAFTVLRAVANVEDAVREVERLTAVQTDRLTKTGRPDPLPEYFYRVVRVPNQFLVPEVRRSTPDND